MQVQIIEVSYLREKQPKDYEKVVPTVKFVANVGEDDDYDASARELMVSAATVVHAGMGLALPATVAKKLGASAPKQESNEEPETKSEPSRAISKTPEDRVNPEDNVSSEEPASEIEAVDVPNDAGDQKVPDGLDHKGLHKYMVDLVTGKATANKKKVDAEAAKAVFAEYDVQRVSDLDESRIPEVYKKLRALQLEAEKE